MSIPKLVSRNRGAYKLAPVRETKPILLGKVKWFGGFNNSTGRENRYGFIESEGEAFFVHRSAVLSTPDLMVEGAEVLFHRIEDQRDKPSANAVRVLSALPDDELVALLKEVPSLAPDLVLTIVLIRKKLPPFTDEVHRALSALGAANLHSSLIDRFWHAFPPSGLSDRFYDLAPKAVKSGLCKKHYSALRHSLLNLLGTENPPPTSITAREVYEDINDDDRKIAAMWAGSEKDTIVAQMLSARGAEKAVARLYRQAGASVDDIAITQLDRAGRDWTTHDLNVDQTIPVDVKNARRPINSKHFYVEHTVPRFKLDRSGTDVRIAGVLSPYLQMRFIENPTSAEFTIDDIVFLGETSRAAIDALIIKYRSPHFEVVRGNERIFPNWVFGHPERWYPGRRDQLLCATDLCRNIPENHWSLIFDQDEVGYVVAALCASRLPLPLPLLDCLTENQANFCKKLHRSLNGLPNVPDIFLTVISDFVEAVMCDRQDYSPAIYTKLLFSDENQHIPLSGISRLSEQHNGFPLGAIDPLNLVSSLIKTLTSLYEKRTHATLKEFTSFRFGGLGLLQARRKDDIEWTTILAYCGGTEYEIAPNGKMVVSETGSPKWKGKCGRTPLVLGRHKTCPNCRKLLCDKCGFCSIACRNVAFRELASASRSSVQLRKKVFSKDSGKAVEVPPWEAAPMGDYEDYFW